MALPSWIGTGRAIPFGPGALPFYNNLNPGQQVTKQYLQQTVPTWNLPEGVKEPPVAPFDWQAFYKEQDEARKRGIEIEPPMIAFKTPEPGRVISPQVIGEIPSGNGLAYGQLTPAQRESFTAWLKANPSPQGFSARMPDANTIIPWSMIGGRPTTTPAVTPTTTPTVPNTTLPNYTQGGTGGQTVGSSPLAQVYANRYRMNATPFPNYYTGRTNPFQNRRSMF